MPPEWDVVRVMHSKDKDTVWQTIHDANPSIQTMRGYDIEPVADCKSPMIIGWAMRKNDGGGDKMQLRKRQLPMWCYNATSKHVAIIDVSQRKSFLFH